MAPPSALAIATQAVQRLVKEESYYHKEQASQETRIKKLEEDIAAGGANLDSNAEYVLKQEKTALEETKKVFEPLKERIVKAVGTLEEQIAISESDGVAPVAELTKAKEALKSGQKVGGLTDE
ncbi:tubulin binding cofactor A [Immersiella caudata]|uniref:Tubulin-specific chaperone A n=1 Tax=Immersiella caudata TaxID=314043 RepID=A0AA39XDH2_9PEZI|nr:tubulin binding cofactor A [Immersiella caudata]